MTFVPKRGRKISGFQKFLEGPTLPVVGTGLGALGGSFLMPVTGGASLPFGMIGGYGGAKVIQESLQDLLGYQRETPQEQLSSAREGVNTAMALGTLGMLGAGALFPMKTVGNIRDVSLKNKYVPQNIKERSLAIMQENNKFGTPDRKLSAQDQLNTFLDQVANSRIPTKMSSVYKELPKFEKQTGAYKGINEAFAQGGEDVSRAVRSVLSADSPWVARRANDVMGALSSAQKFLPKTLPWMGAGGVGLGGYLYNKFKK